MLVLGIESSCDETGIALYDTQRGLLAHALPFASQNACGVWRCGAGAASRDHIRRALPLTNKVLADANAKLSDIQAIAYTQGPGLAGALLVGASIAEALAFALNCTCLGRTSSGRPPTLALCLKITRRIPFCRATGVWRAYTTDARERYRRFTNCWATRWMMQRVRLLIKPPNCWGWIIPGGAALSKLAGQVQASF